ncbi:tetratricopeptide repeat protein [Dermacoccus nishinomiyaensis]
MTVDWDERVDAFWAAASCTDPDRLLSVMRALVSERGEHDPDALYEWASVHDFLGHEEQAVPLYEAALARGLTGARRPQALIQLGSSLRNIGRPEDAVNLLHGLARDEVTGDAAQAFLALALHDAGRQEEALAVALRTLARTLPLYGTAIENYASELSDDSHS